MMKVTAAKKGLFVLACALAVAVCHAGPQQAPDAVLLTGVRALTFRSGAWTTGRRSAPEPQLVCAGSPDRALEPSVVQCTNVGTNDAGDVEWRCEADLDSSVQFDRLSVSCEGYAYPEDPYVLVGSCGLTYSLRRTPAWHEQQRNVHWNHPHQTTPAAATTTATGGGSGLWGLIKFGIFVFVVVKLIQCCTRRRRRMLEQQQPPPVYPMPAGDGVPPPPPYDAATGAAGGMPYPSAPPMPPPPAAAGYYPPPAPAPAPGFWSGLFWGSHLGRPSTVHHYHHGTTTTSTGGSWFSGGSSRSSSGGSSSSGGGSRVATGFASTKRR